MSETTYLQDQPVEATVCRLGGTPTQGLKTVQLTPDGEVESKKGTFIVDEESAALLIAAFERHDTPLVVDYDHASLGGEYASPDGRAPAAG